MESLLNHVKGLKNLLQMNKGATLEKIQASQTRVLAQMIAALPDISVEDACALTAEVKQLALVEACENQLLQSISRALEKDTGNEKQIANRKSFQSWEDFPRFLSQRHWQMILSPKQQVGNLSSLANILILWLISLGLRNPTEGTLGMLTCLLAFHDPVRRHDQPALRAGYLEVKKLWLDAKEAAPAWEHAVLEKLPQQARSLPPAVLREA